MGTQGPPYRSSASARWRRWAANPRWPAAPTWTRKGAWDTLGVMYAHVQLGARDIDLMTRFYDKVLIELGIVRVTPLDRIGPAGVIWRKLPSRWPQFVINEPLNRERASVGNGSQVSFLAPSLSAVDAAWRAALSMGATDCGPPGLRSRYAPDFYAAYCLDPEGHKLCVVHTSD
jgi:hypothetical protein